MRSNKKFIIGASAVLAIILVCVIWLCNGTDAPILPENISINTKITNNDSEEDSLKGLDKEIRTFMRTWSLKGASLAITRNDSLVYAKGYGWADEELEIKMQPGHILRMASVSKLITATGIMTLQDKGMLSIKDTIFGPTGILNTPFFENIIKDKTYHKVTVEHVLRHLGGFYRDPVLSSNDVRLQMRLNHPPTKEDYFKLVLGHEIKDMPGTFQKYSNFGYLLLSEIIEKVSGMKYEDYIQKHVLEPAGCYDMHIAGNYYKDKRANEVRYYTHKGNGKFIEEYNGSGNMVERCYGGSNITLLSGAGAWCGSSIELARFVASIDGDPLIPDIISRSAFEQMIEYKGPGTYSLGWNETDPTNGWSRSGSYSGTCAYIKHFPDGECWILVSNTSTWKGPSQAQRADELFTKCRELYSEKLPAKNLFQ